MRKETQMSDAAIQVKDLEHATGTTEFERRLFSVNQHGSQNGKESS